MSKSVTIVIPGVPVPQGRPKFARRGNFVTTYDPDKSRKWKEHVKEHAEPQVTELFDKSIPLSITAVFYMPRPASVSATKRPFHIVKPDVDNLVKGLTDALTGICWVDDAQIVEIRACKEYSETPQTVLMVEEYVKAQF